MSELMYRWAAQLRAAGAPASTVDLRTYQLGRAARELPVGLLEATGEQLVAWLAGQDWAPATKRGYRAALRSFYSWAIRQGYLERSPADELLPVRVPRGLPRPTPDAAYAAALLAADDRERRALRLGAECGLRRAEIARVRVEDVEADLVGWSLRVLGKGGHMRLVPMPDDLAADLRRLGSGWVFPSTHHSGHLTPGHLGKLVSALLPDGIATHSLRHRAGTRAYAGTKDLRAVQEFLGHAKPETTAIYTQVPAESIRAAMQAAAA